jgi:AraC-like DNA-binding protein
MAIIMNYQAAPHTGLKIINGRPEFGSENVLRDLFNFLMEKVVDQMNEEIPSELEMEAARKAEELIMKNIRKHYTIPDIAKRVELNEYRLKYLFKYTFKSSIFHYLLRARMQKAIELLQYTNKPLQEIARLTGYSHLTNFITAFNKFFEFTPLTVRRAV